MSIHGAAAEIQAAHQRSPEDPWVLIALAKLAMTTGYRSHDVYSPEAVEAAYEFAKKAVENGPAVSMAHAYLGVMLYHRGKNEAAWRSYQKAIELDPRNAMPYFYVATAMNDVRDKKGLAEWIAKAEQAVAGRPVYANRLFSLKRDLANLNKDAVEIERLYREELVGAPDNPWLHGNYAEFLAHHRRYDEAIRYYEKALTIMEYSMARKGLEQARRLQAAAQK